MSKKLGNNIISLICGGNIDTNLFNKIIAWP
jgi:threonine dehydratase